MPYPFRTNLIAAVVALALPGAVIAQQQGQQQGQKQAQQQGQAQKNLGQIRASDLKSMKVVDARGQEIGEIAEVVVDLQSGRLHAAVLEFGGLMGLGEKQYAFSPKELRLG
jgi:sporulation protein YlmC with PRC-barrel domain